MADNQDPSKQNEATFTAKMLDHVYGGYLTLGLAIGTQCGLFNAMKENEQPLTVKELAEKTHCKPRYVEEWLHMMVAADIVNIQENGEKRLFSIEPYKHKALSDSISRCIYVPLLASPYEKLIKCFSESGPNGLEFSDVDSVRSMWLKGRDTFFEDIVQNALPQIPNITSLLEKGIHVLDIGCGNGELQHILGLKYENSTFVGIDGYEKAIGEAKERNTGLPNVSIEVQDVTSLPKHWEGTFDLVCILDTLHDLSFPTKALLEIKRVIKPGGFISVIDINISSDLKEQAKDKAYSVSTYVFSLFHCLSPALNTEGSESLGNCAGKQKLTSLVKQTPFEDIEVKDIPQVPTRFHIIGKK